MERNLDIVKSKRAIHPCKPYITDSSNKGKPNSIFLKEIGLIKENFLEKVSVEHNLIGYQGHILSRRREMNVLDMKHRIGGLRDFYM